MWIFNSLNFQHQSYYVTGLTHENLLVIYTCETTNIFKIKFRNENSILILIFKIIVNILIYTILPTLRAIFTQVGTLQIRAYCCWNDGSADLDVWIASFLVPIR